MDSTSPLWDEDGWKSRFYHQYFCIWATLVVLNYVVNEVVEPSSPQVVREILSVHLVNLGYEFSFPGWEALFPSLSLLLTPPLSGFSDGTFLIRCSGNWVD